jgi:hypothetical protein
MSIGANWYPGTVWSCCRSLIAVGEKEAINKVGSKTRLIKVNSHQQRSNTPQEMDAQDSVDNLCERNLAPFSKKATKESLNSGVF